MLTLSLCMIVRDESDVLARCLTCMQEIADEIIIVDTGSTDDTKEIARRFTPHVYDFAWCEDFAAARNFSFSKATMEYVMWLDADDVIEEEDRKRLLALKAELSSDVDVVMMKYDVAFDAQDNPTLSYYRERLFRRALQPRWVGEVHEVIPQRGVTQHMDISVKHRKLHPTQPGRNLRIFERMLADGKTMDPRQQYYYGRELMYAQRYEEAVAVFEGFLNEGRGWVENSIAACKDLAACLVALGRPGDALQALLRSLTYDVPRAELCCEIGRHFMERGQYAVAAFWYGQATNCTMDDKNGGFCLPDCYGYIPYMQLCVCYDRLGQPQRAMACNERAGEYKPEDPGFLYNRAYFSARK